MDIVARDPDALPTFVLSVTIEPPWSEGPRGLFKCAIGRMVPEDR